MKLKNQMGTWLSKKSHRAKKWNFVLSGELPKSGDPREYIRKDAVGVFRFQGEHDVVTWEQPEAGAGVKRRGNPKRSLNELSASALDRRKNAASERASKATSEMIAAGRGSETFKQTRAKAGQDKLTDRYLAANDEIQAINREIESRMRYHGSLKPIKGAKSNPSKYYKAPERGFKVAASEQITAARKRRAIKRQLRAKGVTVPKESEYDLPALRKLRTANPAPLGFAIFARKGKGPRMHYDGKKFTNNGTPKLYGKTSVASSAGRALLKRYPLLKSYRVTVEPVNARKGNPRPKR